MTSKLSVIIITQFLISKAISSYMQPYSTKQYGGAYRQGVQKTAYPTPYSTDYKAYYSNSYPSKYYSSYPKIPEIPQAPVPVPAPAPAPVPIRQNYEMIRQGSNVIDPKLLATQMAAPNLDALKKQTGKIDSHVLNNIAIALQLLIVNNILNNPPETVDTSPLSESIMEIAFPNGKFRGLDTMQMPGSKFLGSSGFGQDLISSSMLGSYGMPSNPISLRPGLNLMSPYDAIAKSSPISESIVSSFLAKNDFQSPYAAIMAADSNNDLFSMSDLF